MKWMNKEQSDHSFEAFLAGDDYKYVPHEQKFFDSICLNCAHILSLNDETCEAFPDGIPRKF